MRKIMDYYLQQRDDGVGFRLLFDDHTWTDTSYVIPGMNLNYDCDGYSEEEETFERFVCWLQEHNDLTEETFIEAIRKRFGISEEPCTYVASYVSYDINTKKVLEEEHVIVDSSSDFEAYSLDKEANMKDHSNVVWNVFNEFRYLDEDAKVLYYTYLEIFPKQKEVTDGSN